MLSQFLVTIAGDLVSIEPFDSNSLDLITKQNSTTTYAVVVAEDTEHAFEKVAQLKDTLSPHQQRAVNQAMIVAQEKEREHIGKELHDNISQILSTTKMYVDMARNEKEDEDIKDSLLAKSIEFLDTAVKEIRALSQQLVPPSIADIGLGVALSELVESINLTQKVKIDFRGFGLKKNHIDEKYKLVMYRIIQEQLQNIVKHSKATRASVIIIRSDDYIAARVSDNGVGFNMANKTKGMGLSNMISRAEAFNGAVEIQSAIGIGCVVTIKIPF
jgi:two-component system sensor histidine kinase UhpB